jgi:hypothetical protein
LKNSLRAKRTQDVFGEGLNESARLAKLSQAEGFAAQDKLVISVAIAFGGGLVRGL